MGWFKKKVDKLKKLPAHLIILHIFTKFLAGVAIGILLTEYVPFGSYSTWGWVLLVIAIILGLPAGLKILKK